MEYLGYRDLHEWRKDFDRYKLYPSDSELEQKLIDRAMNSSNEIQAIIKSELKLSNLFNTNPLKFFEIIMEYRTECILVLNTPEYPWFDQ